MSAQLPNLCPLSEDTLPGRSGFSFSTTAQAKCLCAEARRAARAVSELYDLVLAPTQIKATQYILLRAIGNAGELTQSQMARQLGVSTESLSRRLASLRAAGWVALRPTSNRRERRYEITPAGKAQLETALPYWIRAENRLRDSLTSEQWSVVFRSLGMLARAAKEAESARLSNALPMQQRTNAVGTL